MKELKEAFLNDYAFRQLVFGIILKLFGTGVLGYAAFCIDNYQEMTILLCICLVLFLFSHHLIEMGNERIVSKFTVTYLSLKIKEKNNEISEEETQYLEHLSQIDYIKELNISIN